MPDKSEPEIDSPINQERPPIVLDLPDELWLDIVELLPYGDIHKVGRICKKFQALVSSEKLDALLFRERPLKKVGPFTNFQIHPLLEATQCTFLDTKNAPVLTAGSDYKEYNAYDLKACDEFATSPSCTLMHVNFGVVKPIIVTDKNGIKNRRVLKAIGKFWTAKPPAYIAAEVQNEFLPLEDVTWLETLGDHRFFEGWKYARGRNDNAVDLVSKWFGS